LVFEPSVTAADDAPGRACVWHQGSDPNAKPWSSDLTSFLRHVLEKDPAARWDAAAMLASPFIKKEAATIKKKSHAPV
jgi:hypothetical protein